MRDRGAALLVDATHSAGVLDLDVQKLDPDFLVFPTYKWLIGPYARAFLYVAKRHQDGIPLEQTSYGRRAVRAEQDVYFTDTRYVGDARRFDMGERDHFISMEMAAIGMEMMAQWGRPAIVERLAMLTARLAEGLRGSGVDIPDARVRAPHILSLAFPEACRMAWWRNSPPRTFSSPRASAACASARMFITTRRTSIASSRYFASLPGCGL